jgi:hypothetical protein
MYTSKAAEAAVHRYWAELAPLPANSCQRHVASLPWPKERTFHTLYCHRACAGLAHAPFLLSLCSCCLHAVQCFDFVDQIYRQQLKCLLISPKCEYVSTLQNLCAGAWCGLPWSRAAGRCRTAWRRSWMQRGWSSTARTAITRCAASASATTNLWSVGKPHGMLARQISRAFVSAGHRCCWCCCTLQWLSEDAR